MTDPEQPRKPGYFRRWMDYTFNTDPPEARTNPRAWLLWVGLVLAGTALANCVVR